MTRERSLGDLAGEAEWGHLLTGGYFSSCPSKPWLPPCMDKDILLLYRGSCLGPVPWRSPGELHQGLCPLPWWWLLLILHQHPAGLGEGGVSPLPAPSCPACHWLSPGRGPGDLSGNWCLQQAAGGLKRGDWGGPMRNWRSALRVLGSPVGNWRGLQQASWGYTPAVPGALLGKRRVCNGESGGLWRRSGGLQQGRRRAQRGARGVPAPSRGSHLLPGGGSQRLLQELPEPRVRGGGRDGAEGQGDGEQGQGALEAARQHLAGRSGAERRRRGSADGSAAARLRRWGSPRRPPPL